MMGKKKQKEHCNVWLFLYLFFRLEVKAKENDMFGISVCHFTIFFAFILPLFIIIEMNDCFV